jgi:hypothetical protein
MKKYIRVYHNGKPLCGSDYTMVIAGNLTNRQLKNRFEEMHKRVEALSKNVAPHLQEGSVEYRVEA